jgi:hypothetical protein
LPPAILDAVDAGLREDDVQRAPVAVGCVPAYHDADRVAGDAAPGRTLVVAGERRDTRHGVRRPGDLPHTWRAGEAAASGSGADLYTLCRGIRSRRCADRGGATGVASASASARTRASGVRARGASGQAAGTQPGRAFIRANRRRDGHDHQRDQAADIERQVLAEVSRQLAPCTRSILH